MKYFKNYDIIYVKQKSKGIFIVNGLYPNETDKKRSGTRAPLHIYTSPAIHDIIAFTFSSVG